MNAALLARGVPEGWDTVEGGFAREWVSCRIFLFWGCDTGDPQCGRRGWQRPCSLTPPGLSVAGLRVPREQRDQGRLLALSMPVGSGAARMGSHPCRWDALGH